MATEFMDAGTYAWIVIIIFFLIFTAVRVNNIYKICFDIKRLQMEKCTAADRVQNNWKLFIRVDMPRLRCEYWSYQLKTKQKRIEANMQITHFCAMFWQTTAILSIQCFWSFDSKQMFLNAIYQVAVVQLKHNAIESVQNFSSSRWYLNKIAVFFSFLNCFYLSLVLPFNPISHVKHEQLRARGGKYKLNASILNFLWSTQYNRVPLLREQWHI